SAPTLNRVTSSLLASWNCKCTQQFCDSRSVTRCNVPESRGIWPPARDLRSLVCSVIGEVCMMLMRWSTVKTTKDVVSGILNWVCPECDGRMGGRGTEFKDQGKCQMDWCQ